MKNRKQQEQLRSRRSSEQQIGQAGAPNKGSTQMRVVGTTGLGPWNDFVASKSTHIHIYV